MALVDVVPFRVGDCRGGGGGERGGAGGVGEGGWGWFGGRGKVGEVWGVLGRWWDKEGVGEGGVLQLGKESVGGG